MNAFMVDGSSGNKYGVTLSPKPKCPCPATRDCYHIIAAQLLSGTYIEKKSTNKFDSSQKK